MYMQIAGIVAIALAALFQFGFAQPWLSGAALLVAAAMFVLPLLRDRGLTKAIERLADNFGRSRNHTANLDRQMKLGVPALAKVEDNLNNFLSELQSGIGQVRCANVRIAANVASIGFQMRQVVAISTTQREQTAAIVTASDSVVRSVEAVSHSSRDTLIYSD